VSNVENLEKENLKVNDIKLSIVIFGIDKPENFL